MSAKKRNDWFRQATEAMANEDWDTAIMSLRAACRLQAGNLVYRQSLRACQYRKHGKKDSGTAGLGVETHRRFYEEFDSIRDRIAEAQRRWDWDACDEAIEDGLMLNPWDAELLANLGEVCRERGFTDVAIDSYKRAILVDRDNIELRQTLEDLLDEFGE